MSRSRLGLVTKGFETKSVQNANWLEQSDGVHNKGTGTDPNIADIEIFAVNPMCELPGGSTPAI
jgi:hypothetical protein